MMTNYLRCFFTFTTVTVAVLGMELSTASSGEFECEKFAIEEGKFESALDCCMEKSVRLLQGFRDDRCPWIVIGNIFIYKASSSIMNRISEPNPELYNADKYNEILSSFYTYLTLASKFLPEDTELVSKQWADTFWEVSEKAWREAEEILEEASEIWGSSSGAQDKHGQDELLASVIRLTQESGKRRLMAFQTFRFAEEVYPTYALLRCLEKQTSSVCETDERMREIRTMFEIYHQPVRFIEVPDKEMRKASRQQDEFAQKLADVARRAAQSDGALITVGTHDVSSEYYDWIYATIAKEYHGDAANVSVCEARDYLPIIRVEFLRLEESFEFETLLDSKKYSGEELKCRYLKPLHSSGARVVRVKKNSEMNEYMADKMVRVIVDVGFGNSSSMGSGFAVNDRGYVVTNRHVVCPEASVEDGAEGNCMGKNRPTRINVRWVDRIGTIQEGRASVVATWRDLDLAVIVLMREATLSPEERLTPLSLADQDPEPLLEVLSYGYPAEGDLFVRKESGEAYVTTVTDGIVSRVIEGAWERGGQHRFRIVQHDAAISPGNSGGPVVDRCGRVVGVNTMKRRVVLENGHEVPSAEGIAFAISARELNTRLKKSGVERIADSLPCPER